MYNDESEDIYVNDTISIDEDEWEEQQNDTTIDKDTNYTSKIANIDDDTTAQKKIHDIVFSHVNLQKTTILSPSQLIRSLNTTKKRQKECVKTKNINKKKRYSYLNTIEPSTTIQDTGKDDKIHDDDSIKTYIDKLTTPCVYHTLYILWLSDMIRYIHVSSIPSFTKICLSYIKDNEIYKSLQYKYNNNISLSIDTIKKYLNYIFCDRVDDTVIDLMDIKDIDNTIDTLFINIQDFIDTHGMRYTYNMMNLKDHIKNMNLLNIVTQLYALITASNIPTEDEVRSLTKCVIYIYFFFFLNFIIFIYVLHFASPLVHFSIYSKKKEIITLKALSIVKIRINILRQYTIYQTIYRIIYNYMQATKKSHQKLQIVIQKCKILQH